MKRWMSLIALFLLAAVLYFGVALTLPQESFWICDCGNKFLVMQQYLLGVSEPGMLPYPGREIDPEGKFFPVREPFATRGEDGFRSAFPPFFSILSSLPYRIFGFRGLYLIPLLSTLLLAALVLCFRAGTDAGRPSLLYTAAVLFGTPLLFYSFVFWEHAPAVLLFGAGVMLVLRTRGWLGFLAAAVLFGLAISLREEAFLAVAALLAATPFLNGARRSIRGVQGPLALGMVSGAALTIALNGFESVRVHYTANLDAEIGIANWAASRLGVAHTLLLANNLNGTLDLVLSAVLIALVVWRVLAGRSSRWSLAAYGLLLLFFCGNMLLSTKIDWQLLEGNGLLLTWPILFLTLSRGGGGPRPFPRPFYLTFLGCFAGLTILVCPEQAASGIHWSARLLLFIVPVTLLYARRHLTGLLNTVPLKRSLILIVTGCTLFLQVFSVTFIYERRIQNRRLNQALERMPGVPIASFIPLMGQELAPIYMNRRIFFVPDAKDLPEFRNELVAAGVEELAIVEYLEAQSPAEAVAESPFGRFGLYDFQIRRLRIAAPESGG
ncbi:MAG: hypothetical protein GF355_12730 [Candidatus Eisenbacteria bacterium]|nr:hypothetical protein [Candidatus Eisenbacteria bacterium]